MPNSPRLLHIPFLVSMGLVALASNSCWSQDKASEVDESKEPALEYTLVVGDQTVPIIEGQTKRLEGSFSNPEVRLTAKAHRVFPYQGVSFRYPRGFVFEAELEDADNKTWTLSGNDLTIMFFVVNGPLTTASFAESMIDQFGDENCKISNADAKIAMGDLTLNGTSLQVSVASHNMVMDIYQVPTGGFSSTIIVFQDNLDDAGNRSAEGEQALKGITESFKLNR